MRNIIDRIACFYFSGGIIATGYLIWWWYTPIWKYQVIISGWNGPIIITVISWIWIVLSLVVYQKVLRR